MNYTPLEPFALMSFNIVALQPGKIVQNRDVLIGAHRMFDIRLGINEPFIICRQSIHDFFSDLMSKNPLANDMVGISVTRDNCPTNITMTDLTACYTVEESTIVHHACAYVIGKFNHKETSNQCIIETAFDLSRLVLLPFVHYLWYPTHGNGVDSIQAVPLP